MITKESRRHAILDSILDGNSPDYVSQATVEGIRTLSRHPQEFFLTGSRFFDTYRRRSDFDFYTQYNDGIAIYLKDSDFEETHDPSYNDALTAHVFGLGKVHVQLVKDVALKTRIQQALADHAVMKRLRIVAGRDKEFERQVWNAMLTVVMGGKSSAKVQIAPAGKYCSCSGEKVQRTIDGHSYYWYCKGCGKEHVS